MAARSAISILDDVTAAIVAAGLDVGLATRVAEGLDDEEGAFASLDVLQHHEERVFRRIHDDVTGLSDSAQYCLGSHTELSHVAWTPVSKFRQINNRNPTAVVDYTVMWRVVTTDLRQSLERLEHGLESLGRAKLLDALNPGVKPAVTRHMLSTLGLGQSPELDMLYHWRNGTGATSHALGDLYIFPGYYFLSQADIWVDYAALVEDSRWHPGWLPVLADGGGDYYAVDLTAGGTGSVRHFRNYDVEHPVEFDSLTDMVRTLAEGYERSVFFVDDHGYLEMDDSQFEMLAAEMNQTVSWWR